MPGPRSRPCPRRTGRPGSRPRRSRTRAGGPRRGRRGCCSPGSSGTPFGHRPAARARRRARAGSRSAAAARRGAGRRRSARRRRRPSPNGSGVAFGSRLRRYSSSFATPSACPMPSRRTPMFDCNAYAARLQAREVLLPGRASPPDGGVSAETGLEPASVSLEPDYNQGKSAVDSVDSAMPQGRASGEDADGAEPRRRLRRRSSSPGMPSSSSSASASASRSSCAAPSWSACAPPSGSGTIASITPSSRQCAASGLNAAAAFFACAGVAPEDRRAALGRDHRVDRVLLHQHAVGERDRDRAAGAALADHARDRRHLEPRHHGLRARDRAALAVLLGGDARIRAGRVDERERPGSRAGRRAPSPASPCGSPRDRPSRSCGARAP